LNLDQFKNWAVNEGSVAKTDGGYLGECVSLINQYLSKVYGIQAGAWGNAYAWANDNNPVRAYFDKVGSPQAGDIGVMGTNYGGGLGHIFIYLSPTTILEQNGRVARKVSTGSAYANPIAILRRKGAPAPEGGDMPARIQDIQKIAYWAQGIPPDYPDLQLWVGLPMERVIEEFWAMDNSQNYQQRVQAALRGGSQYEEVPGPLYKKK
jgi:hypothetical protein